MNPRDHRSGDGPEDITEVEGTATFDGTGAAEADPGDTMADRGPVDVVDTVPVELVTDMMPKLGPVDLLETDRQMVRPPIVPSGPVSLRPLPQPASLEPAASVQGLLETGTQRLPPPPSVEMSVPSVDLGNAAGDRELAPGTVLGDYRIESRIARGGMGDVYRGVHRVIKKRAAIKVLRADVGGDEGTVARFTTEARVVNEIGHPNIVDIFAFGQTDDGRHYLIMELLEGESLRTRLTRGALDVEQICAITRPLVRALMAAHARGVIHRDLKPDNVFLLTAQGGEPEVVKLLDFGLAKLTRSEPGLEETAKGVLVGTPLYIAPEQARGRTVDRKADVYTLGGVMFEMLTGRPPFTAATTIELLTKHASEPAPQPSIHGRVPAELDDLVVRMLAKDPTQRPELARVLEVLDGFADLARRPTEEMEMPRESVDSIAVTSKRQPSQQKIAPLLRPERSGRTIMFWLILGLILAGAVTTIIGIAAMGS